MRLLIVGTLEGHITTAGKIALSRGAKVAQAPCAAAAAMLGQATPAAHGRPRCGRARGPAAIA